MSTLAANMYEKKQKNTSLSKLLSTLSPYKLILILGTVFGLIGTASRLAGPIFVQKISEIILKTPVGGTCDVGQVALFALLGIGLYVVGFLFDYACIHMMIGVTSATSKTLRTRMEAKINTLPLNYFDTRNIGDVLSYFTNDVDIIDQTLTLALSSLISSAVTIVGVIVILFVLSWPIALVSLGFLPIALFVLVLIGTASEKQFQNRQNATSLINSQAEEGYTAHDIIKVFGATKRFKNKFANDNYKLEKATHKADFLGDLMTPAMTLIGNLLIATICLLGAWLAEQIDPSLAEQRATAIATIVTAVTYGNQLLQPLTQLAQIFANLTQASAAASRVFAFLEEKDQEDESMKKGKIDNIEGNISFEHVRFGYNADRVIIHNFSENAKKGQKVAIVGPTGAGKTTMVNLLMRFYDINEGKISIEGVDTKTLNRSYVRGLFGMVLQDTWLFEGTYMENLKFSRRDATDEEVYEACKATHCDTFIRQQPGGYNGLISEECGLSSGQKQLLTIARAMIQNAPMLILDEATSSVDTRTELLIQDAMDKLMKGRTSFVIAHRLSTIKNSDLILVMRDGDVIESGNHNELMAKKGFYADLYNAQFTGKGPQID